VNEKGEFYKILMAKSDRGTGELWLPLWMHLRDTAGIMKKLVIKWLPKSVYTAAHLKEDAFLKAAVFLGAVHDLGKATSYFQGMITQSCPEKFGEMTASGFVVRRDLERGKTPHAHAGQWILESGEPGFGIHESLAAVVGAHHGKPLNVNYLGQTDPMRRTDLMGQYSRHIFGVGEKESDEQKGVWINSWKELMKQAMEWAGIQRCDELPVLTLEAQVLLSGLLIVADWIASNPSYFPLLTLEDYGEESLYPGRINEGWRKIAFPDGWCSEIYTMDEKLFEERFGFPTNEVQRAMLEVVNQSTEPGIFILEAQMGVGKTEAALGAAEVLASRKQEGGIFFGLPTQATSNGLFPRLYEWSVKVSKDTENAVRLAHGSAELNEEYRKLLMRGKACMEEDELQQDGMEVHPWFQGNKRALLADFVTGTVDQFLMAALRRKHFMLRHIGLAGKVVVIDECHAYDAFMNQYLMRALEWMAAYGVSVILLSATLPAKRRKELVNHYVKAYSRCRLSKKPEIKDLSPGWENREQYPLLTWTDGETIDQKSIDQAVSVKRVKLSYVNSVSDLIFLLKSHLQDGGCACIIVNTVKYAQMLYEQCTAALEEVTVLLYHAQFLMPHRIQKERALLERMGKASKSSDRNRVILIGTQVLEQSLDYDTDLLITQLCPIDLLLQRIGRLHRHEQRLRPERLRNPECILLQEETESYDAGTKAIYGDYLLMRTQQVLSQEITIPDDISHLVQLVYPKDDQHPEKEDLGIEGERYSKAIEDYKKQIQDKKEEAKKYLLPRPGSKNEVICNILENSDPTNEKLAEASVRDAAAAVEVLVMRRETEDGIGFVEETSAPGPVLSRTHVPSSEEGQRVAMQRLKLPYVFSAFSKNREDTIRELEEKNLKELPEWQQSPWIQGELILLLDQDNRAELLGYRLSYSFEKGLECERMKREI